MKFTAMAHIHSLNGEMREITVLDKRTVFGRPLENESTLIVPNSESGS